MTKLALTKPVQTRDGYPVRILCTDRVGKYQIIGLILEDDHEYVETWNLNGQKYEGAIHDDDLINVPPKPVKCYINVYRNDDGVLYAGMLRRDEPYDIAGKNFVKTIEFEVP